MRSFDKPSELKQGQIAVWFACVDRSLPEIQEFEAVISPEEAARAQRFHSARDRDRYIVQHGVLRSLLAGYLRCEPRQVDIRTRASGKPFLAGSDAGGSLQFSASGSGLYTAFAFGRCNRIGVDIEEVRDLPEMQGIVDQHFTPREKHEVSSCPKERRLLLFYRLWARKEAVLKAQGEGLLKDLVSVDVATGEGAGPWRVGIDSGGGVEGYSVVDIDGPPGYAMAVSMSSHISRISVHPFPLPE